MTRRDRAALRWMEITIRRAARRAVRHEMRYARREVPTDPFDRLLAGAEPAAEPDADALDVQEALQRLPEAERMVLMRGEVKDMTQRQIAAALDCPPSRVRSLRRRALWRMRKLLVREDDGDG